MGDTIEAGERGGGAGSSGWKRWLGNSTPGIVAIDVVVSIMLSFAITAVTMAPFYGTTHGLGIGVFFLVMPLIILVPFLPYAGVIATILYGLFRFRPGFIVGALLLAGTSFLLATLQRQWDRDEITHLATATLALASKAHDVIAVQGRSTECDVECRNIVATRPFAAAMKADRSKQWVIWRRAEGEVCASDEHAKSALEFLLLGYPGMCAVKSSAQDIPDAMMFRERSVSDHWPAPGLPPNFTGKVYEISERTGGVERLLGRRLTGGLASRLPLAVAGFDRRYPLSDAINVGPQIEYNDFLAAASGISSAQLHEQRTIPLAATLDEIERYFDRADVQRLAPWMWLGVLRGQGRGRSDVWRPRVERLLASDDPVRIGVALEALWDLPAGERSFAQDRFIELAFSPLTGMKDSPIPSRLNGHLMSPAEPFPSEVRARAKARFLDDASLTSEHRQIFFMLMVRGGPATRQEAVDTLFALRGENFVDAVLALNRGENRVWAGNQPDRWLPEEADRLLARLPDVSNRNLKFYADGLRVRSRMSEEQKQKLLEHVRERLRLAEIGQPWDEQLIRDMKFLVQNVRR
jgi:hypothetical protein